MSEYSVAIVIDADGKAAVGEFDAVTGTVVNLYDAADLLKDKTKAAGDEASSASRKFGALGESIEKNVVRAAKGAALALVGMIGLQVEAADRAGKLAEKLGVSTEWISSMGYAADASGTSLTKLTDGLGVLGNNATKAAGGGRQQVALFEALGISAVDTAGNIRTLDALLPEIADKFAGMQDGAGKAALAQRLFGTAGRELIPMLNQGAAGIDDMRKRAEELGLVISDETAAGAAELKDNIDLLKANLLGMATDIMRAVLPALVEITSHTDEIVGLIELVGTIAAVVYGQKLLRGALDYGRALADLVVKNQAVAAAEGARGAASQAGLMASIKSVGLLQAAYSVFAGAVVGWSIGTYLREQFVEARLFGIAFVEGVLVGWERIKQFGSIAWAGVKAAFFGAVNLMRDELADFVGSYAKALSILPDKLGGAEIAAKLKQWESAIRPTASAADELAASVKAADAEFEANAASIRAITGDMADYEIAAEAAKNRTQAVAAEIKKGVPPVLALDDGLGRAKQRAKDLADAAAELDDIFDDATGGTDLYAEAARALRDDLVALAEIEAKFPELAARVQQARQALVDQYHQQTLPGIDDELRKREQQQNAAEQLLANLDREIELLDLTGDSRERAEAEMRAEIAMRNAIESAIAAGNSALRDEAEQLRLVAEARKRAGDAFDKEREQRQQAQMGRFGGMVNADGSVTSFNNAFEFLGGLLDSVFKRGAEGMKDVFSNFTKQWQKAEGPAGKTQFVAETISAVANFAQGVMAAFERNPDAPLRALQEVAAQIPGVVGAVAQAIGSIDALFGGRLLGTNFETEGGARNVSFGPTGVSGSQSLTEVRQRGLFRGREWRTTTSAMDAQALSSLRAFWDQISAQMARLARELGAEVPQMIAGAFKQEFDAQGHLIKEGGTIAGRYYAESLEAFQQRIAGENLLLVAEAAWSALGKQFAESLAKVASSSDAGGDFGGGGGGGNPPVGPTTAAQSEIQQIANRWRGDAADLLAGAQYLLMAIGAIRDGTALLGDASLTATTDFVERLSYSGESMSEAFNRLVISTRLLEEATGLMGIELGLGREAFVEFAAGIAEAAGGIERAGALWQRYFETFYSAEERLTVALSTAEGRRDRALEAIGVNPSVTAAQFRELFESALPTLSPEDIALWLTASSAIADVNDATAALADTQAEYAGFVRDLADAIVEQEGSTMQRERLRIERATAGYIADANAIARARGEEGASARDLALIHRWAANELKRALAQVEGAARDLAASLGYDQLSQIEQQIAAAEAAQQASSSAQIDGINAVGDAAANLFQQWEDGIKSLNDYLDGLLVGELSPLAPEEQLAEAQRQLDAAIAAAGNGDVSALNAIPQLADRFFSILRDFEASGADYSGPVQQYIEQLRGLGVNPYSAATGGGMPDTVQLVPSPELQALYERRDALLAEQQLAEREARAQELAAYLVEIARMRSETVFEAAERMGVNFSQFVTDLGAGVGAETAEAVIALGIVANTLGVELPEIAEQLGISLGELSDAQSLINDAFELQLAELPEGFRDQIEPAFRALEDADNTAEAVTALERLNALTNELPEEFRVALAPYLANVDPITDSSFDDLDYLSGIDENTRLSRTLLESILNELRGVATPDGGGIQQPGSPDQPLAPSAAAPPETNNKTLIGGGDANVVLLDEVRALRDEVARLTEVINDRSRDAERANTAAQQQSADRVVVAIDGLRFAPSFSRTSS